MIFNRKIRLIVTDEQARILDSQSKKCNWLYNQLLAIARDDYINNGNSKKLLSGRNLRNQVPILKQDNPFLKTVHSSPLKNVALRLKDAYMRSFKQGNGLPKFRAWKKKWFSLLYDEPNKGFRINGRELKLSLGTNKEGKRLYITLALEDTPASPESTIKNLRITKDHKAYYAVFCIEKPDKKPAKRLKWIALDPNHKNLMVGINQDGVSYEFKNLTQIKYWDKVIDRLKSKRDVCLRKAKFIETYEGRGYWQPSKRWLRINKALDKAYNARREQIKQGLYAIANRLAKTYDLVLMGDYTPTLETAKYDNMHRSMLNRTAIAKARKIIAWVMEKSGKHFKEVAEEGTTKTCSFCGHEEKKDPTVRVFTCPNCQTTLSRDINSAINIAKKENLLPCLGYVEDLSRTTYTVAWDYTRCDLMVQMN
ncbi:transposase IS605 OrfB [Desulfotomaculum nigrificans CO-1-SRB]|uniref:Transposase IS605 OrfB n=1 Tax=Desulfotomaculum nigrificans (strain DSM 14880 / VKM B-2319 / CO-1-SRB) TaxID=868595 RepID=F6B9V1_DESCC|nr:RNA-guided endonuclease TnpB family protein [Desulfotomaculum nigrificans]AEF93799.1 transposase IS605 OrfB [Desulfotomaculum nigrificans CO-1-SRB]